VRALASLDMPEDVLGERAVGELDVDVRDGEDVACLLR